MGYITSGLVGHAPRGERAQWAAALGSKSVKSLGMAMMAWQGSDGLDREAFRRRFVGSSVSDRVVDQLRAAGRGAAWGRTDDELAYAGGNLLLPPRRWESISGRDWWPISPAVLSWPMALPRRSTRPIFGPSMRATHRLLHLSALLPVMPMTAISMLSTPGLRYFWQVSSRKRT